MRRGRVTSRQSGIEASRHASRLPKGASIASGHLDMHRGIEACIKVCVEASSRFSVEASRPGLSSHGASYLWLQWCSAVRNFRPFLLKRLYDNVQFHMVRKVVSGVLRNAQTLVSWSLRC